MGGKAVLAVVSSPELPDQYEPTSMARIPSLPPIIQGSLPSFWQLPLFTFPNTLHIKSSSRLAGIDPKTRCFQGDIGPNLCQAITKPRFVLFPRSWCHQLTPSCSRSACWAARTDREGHGSTLRRSSLVFSLFSGRIMHPPGSLREAGKVGWENPHGLSCLASQIFPRHLTLLLLKILQQMEKARAVYTWDIQGRKVQRVFLKNITSNNIEKREGRFFFLSFFPPPPLRREACFCPECP